MNKSIKRGLVEYSEYELLLAIRMTEKLEKITDIMLYFLGRQNIKFTYILIEVESDNFGDFLRKNKRNTDVLVPIDDDNHISVIVCQETDIKGGFKFAERLMRLLDVELQKNVDNCLVMTVSTSRYSNQEIVMNLVERYLILKNEENRSIGQMIDFSVLS